MSSDSADTKLEQTDFDVFQALAALDKKDYSYFDRLTEEQQNKFVPYMMLFWMSAVKTNNSLMSKYYLQSTDHHANKYFFNEEIQNHPKLQWLMLCSISPNLGKQFHEWVPHLSTKVSTLKEPAKLKQIRDYFDKLYPVNDINYESWVNDQHRKVYIASKYPNLKLDEIEVLNKIITDEEISQYTKEEGSK